MKIIFAQNPRVRPGASSRSRLAYTLPEMLVSSAIFIMMSLGVVMTMMFGMRYDQLVTSKLGSTEMARMSFDDLMADIRNSKKGNIGNGSFTSFTPYSNQTALVGTALQLYTDANNASNYTRYWFDTNNYYLCRMVSGASTYTIVAKYLTNASGTGMTFRAMDYAGNLMGDITYKSVVVVTMEFCQYQYPITKVGPGNYYDYYRIQVMAASHAPN